MKSFFVLDLDTRARILGRRDGLNTDNHSLLVLFPRVFLFSCGVRPPLVSTVAACRWLSSRLTPHTISRQFRLATNLNMAPENQRPFFPSYIELIQLRRCSLRSPITGDRPPYPALPSVLSSEIFPRTVSPPVAGGPNSCRTFRPNYPSPILFAGS